MLIGGVQAGKPGNQHREARANRWQARRASLSQSFGKSMVQSASPSEEEDTDDITVEDDDDDDADDTDKLQPFSRTFRSSDRSSSRFFQRRPSVHPTHAHAIFRTQTHHRAIALEAHC